MIAYILIPLIFIFLFYLLMICPNESRYEQIMMLNHTLFAHRGYHDKEHLIPENSMLAFQSAVKENLAIELDIHLTKDNQIVVFHDDSLKRVCNVSGIIKDWTYEELSALHLFNTSEKIPLLSDVLSYIDGRVPLLIEIKSHKNDTAICHYAYELLQKYTGTYLIQSFNSFALHWFKQNAPQVLRGQLSSNLTASTGTDPFILRFAVKFLLVNFLGRPDFISYKLEDVNNLSLGLIQFLYRAPIAVWTIRNEAAMNLAMTRYNMVIFENFRK
ncbi:MAG: glycerophosphodiester phosphodiesterase family protein [Lachnospiraceae bacterium]